MEMIDVLKRLAALDANNPNVETTMLPEQSLATMSNTGAEPADLNECGMGATMPHHSPASINMTANSGEELSSMLRDIMSLAGVKSSSSEPAIHGREIEIGAPHAVDFDPNADMAAAISKIDKLNGGDDEENEGMLGALGGAAVGGMAAGPLGALTGAAAGDSLTDPDGDEDEEENEGMLGTAAGAGLGSILGGPVGAAVGGIAGDAIGDMNDGDEDEGKESWDNSPEQEIEPHDYGDKQVTPKPQGFKQRMGDNPYKMTKESIDEFANRLLSEFQAFKNG